MRRVATRRFAFDEVRDTPLDEPVFDVTQIPDR
jgi:hypothetical protein